MQQRLVTLQKSSCQSVSITAENGFVLATSTFLPVPENT